MKKLLKSGFYFQVSFLAALFMSLLSACASAPSSSEKVQVALQKPRAGVPSCVVRLVKIGKYGLPTHAADHLMAFAVNNVDGIPVRSLTESLSPTVNAKCESADGRLSCTLGDAKRPTYIKASATTLGETLTLKLLEGSSLYEIECRGVIQPLVN